MTRPLPISEIRGINSGPAGRPRTSTRPSGLVGSGAHPFTADAAELLDLSSECRFAACAFAVRSTEVEAAAGFPSAEATGYVGNAYQLQKAARLLGELAQDGEALRILAHRAAGGSVECGPPLVVVGEEQHDAVAPGNKLRVFGWLSRRLGPNRAR